MVDGVAQHLARLGKREMFTGDDDVVFGETDGSWLQDDRLRRRYEAAIRAAGLPGLRFRDLRHTFGSLAITRADIVEVQAWMVTPTSRRRCATSTIADRPPSASPTRPGLSRPSRHEPPGPRGPLDLRVLRCWDEDWSTSGVNAKTVFSAGRRASRQARSRMGLVAAGAAEMGAIVGAVGLAV
jgi:hypothetical protein